MTPLRIIMNADGAIGDLLPGATEEQVRAGFGKAESIAALKAGTKGGKPTVYLAGRLPDGTPVMLETTLDLLTAAVNAFHAKHGG